MAETSMPLQSVSLYNTYFWVAELFQAVPMFEKRMNRKKILLVRLGRPALFERRKKSSSFKP